MGGASALCFALYHAPAAALLFKGLTAAADGDAPNWNFHKYLVGRDGKLIASYGANQNPSDDPLKQQIIDALGH